jgi:hypothetical protein
MPLRFSDLRQYLSHEISQEQFISKQNKTTSQLWRWYSTEDEFQKNLEGQERLELSTPCLRGRCSNQLSYWPESMFCVKYCSECKFGSRAPCLFSSCRGVATGQLSYWPESVNIVKCCLEYYSWIITGWLEYLLNFFLYLQ